MNEDLCRLWAGPRVHTKAFKVSRMKTWRHCLPFLGRGVANDPFLMRLGIFVLHKLTEERFC